MGLRLIKKLAEDEWVSMCIVNIYYLFRTRCSQDQWWKSSFAKVTIKDSSESEEMLLKRKTGSYKIAGTSYFSVISVQIKS